MSEIQSMYVDSSACVRVKGGESEWFRIDSRMRQGYIYGWNDEGSEDWDGKEGSMISGGWERVEIAWPLGCR